ncbi:MAG: hypothetical protein HYX68_15015 [Planctomycetes bacterium]|nr:hypothetical protein [Planctomycetota bacterium]
MMGITRWRWVLGLMLPLVSMVWVAGCYNTPVNVSGYSQGPAPLREPGPGSEDCSYEDSLQGQKVFQMYCASCHNARTLSERPFSNYQNVAQHMRVRANLTGKEYAVLIAWMRRWHDVPPPGQGEAPSPKRFFFSQPVGELKDQKAKSAPDPVAGPRAGANSELSPGQPFPGFSPREAR